MRGEDPEIANWTRAAAHHHAQGHIAKAEAYSRNILDRVPDHAASLNLLGVIAAGIGYPDLAAEYFQKALAADPTNASAKENLSVIRCNPMRRPIVEGERFLVIEAWGSGFWSDVCHVLGCLLLAEITGRIPVTHWGRNSLYSAGEGDAFRTLFDPVSAVTLEDVRALEVASFFPPRWSVFDWPVPARSLAEKTGLSGIWFLNRPETVAVSDSYVSVFQLLPWIPKTHAIHGLPVDVVYRALMEKYLHPKGSVMADADAFCRERIAGRKTIAVHVRGSDKWSEVRASHGAEKYFAVLDREDEGSQIFLLTDDLRILAAFKNRYGERVVATDCQRTGAPIGLHMQPATDRAQLAREVMVDVFVALRCDAFFGMGWSNVSAVIAMLKPWAGHCRLLGPSILMDRFV